MARSAGLLMKVALDEGVRLVSGPVISALIPAFLPFQVEHPSGFGAPVFGVLGIRLGTPHSLGEFFGEALFAIGKFSHKRDGRSFPAKVKNMNPSKVA